MADEVPFWVYPLAGAALLIAGIVAGVRARDVVEIGHDRVKSQDVQVGLRAAGLIALQRGQAGFVALPAGQEAKWPLGQRQQLKLDQQLNHLFLDAVERGLIKPQHHPHVAQNAPLLKGQLRSQQFGRELRCGHGRLPWVRAELGG